MTLRPNRPKGELNGFLDAGSRMTGDLHFEDTFRVDGHLEGKVRSSGDLVVGDGGEVEGEIEVGRLCVTGTVRGVVKAARRVEISAGGRMLADIDTPALVIDEGAFLEGRCSMSAREGERSTGRQTAAGVVRTIEPRR